MSRLSNSDRGQLEISFQRTKYWNRVTCTRRTVMESLAREDTHGRKDKSFEARDVDGLRMIEPWNIVRSRSQMSILYYLHRCQTFAAIRLKNYDESRCNTMGHESKSCSKDCTLFLKIVLHLDNILSPLQVHHVNLALLIILITEV